jgi:hypothetical protein
MIWLMITLFIVGPIVGALFVQRTGEMGRAEEDRYGDKARKS